MGTVADSNESREYILPILHASVSIARRLTSKKMIIRPKQENVGEEVSGRVDYVISEIEDFLCITEGKQNMPAIGFVQNLLQLESSCHINQNKPKANQAFGYEYLYGIVTTGKGIVLSNFQLN